MLIDKLENRGRYLSCHENIARALAFVAEHADGKDLEDGVYTLVPDEVVIHVFTKDTHAREELKMEIHQNFMDIHAIIEGAESCGVAPLAPMDRIDYDPETDNGFWECEDSYHVTIGKGEFYAVWPLEPHCPLCSVGEPGPVRKFVCKVMVS